MCKCHKAPVYRWRSVEWIGLPMPLRWKHWLKAVWGGNRLCPVEYAARFPGCGCIKPLKDLFSRILL